MKEYMHKLQRIANHESNLLREKSDLSEKCMVSVVNKVNSIMNDKDHPLDGYYQEIKSGKRLRSLRCQTSRYLNSFVPYSIRVFNNPNSGCAMVMQGSGISFQIIFFFFFNYSVIFFLFVFKFKFIGLVLLYKCLLKFS